MYKIVIWIFIFLGLCSCKGGLQHTEYQKVRKANEVSETIYRKTTDNYLQIPKPKSQALSAYPWQQKEQSKKLPPITKEYFRCRGDGSNPTYMLSNKERLFDCQGSLRHSLPIIEEKEHVYPILLELLNYLQKKLERKVVITCGHRCPQHNRYSDPSESNRTSKHMIGAEVDFYVEGFEKKPEVIVHLLMDFYKQNPETKGQSIYEEFKRYTKADAKVVTPPWYNQEVYIKIYSEKEGRDLDNQHPYPYISIQVRNDRGTQKRVTYTWEQAFYSYLRY